MKVLPTLRQIQYMTALADLRHFGKAAEVCAVTQSTLSAAILELEAILGVSLFERNKRSVIPTPSGVEAIRRGRELLRHAEELVDAVTATEGLSGRLRVGVIPTIGPYLLPRVLPIVQERFPTVSIYLYEDQTARLIDELERGNFDFLILALPYPTGGFVVEELFEDPFVLACPPTHPLAQKDTISPAELENEHLLLMEEGHCLREHALSVCKRASQTGDIQGTGLYTLVQMAAGGLGVTLLPKMAVRAGVLNGTSLIVRAMGAGTPARSIGMVWRKSAPRAAYFSLFSSLLRDVYHASLASDSEGELSSGSSGSGK